MQVAKYIASLSMNIDQVSVKNVDRQLLATERRIGRFSVNVNKKLTQAFLNFKLPPLKIKSFKLDELKLQAETQGALTRIGRLVELPINRFALDQVKLNRQVLTALQRAANQAKGAINIKSITGNTGGYGVHHVGGNTPGSRAYVAGGVGGAGRVGGIGVGAGAAAGGMAALAGYGGPAALGYAGVRSFNAFSAGNADAVSNRHAITNVVASPTGTYEENSARGKKAFDYLYNESNRLGMNAKGQAEGYGKTLAAGMASGLSLEDSQKMFSNLSEHSTVLHLSGEKQNRLLYALSQVMAKG